MVCPYCAEEIKDEAVFCRYCRHDLTFFRLTEPMMRRISSLEDQVEEITLALNALRSSDQHTAVDSHPDAIDTRPYVPTVVDDLPSSRKVRIVLLTAILQGVALTIAVLPFRLQMYEWGQFVYLCMLFASLVIIPWLGGTWVGASWRGAHFRSYAAFGALSGFMATLLSDFAEFTLLGDQSWEGVRWTEVVLILISKAVVYAFFASMSFITGGLLGDSIEKRRGSTVGKPPGHAEAQESVRAAVGPMAHSDKGRYHKVSTEILKVLQPFVPLLTGLLSVAGPILLWYLGIK